MIQYQKYNFKTHDGRRFHAQVLNLFESFVEVQILSKTIFDKVYIVLSTEVIHLKDIKID